MEFAHYKPGGREFGNVFVASRNTYTLGTSREIVGWAIHGSSEWVTTELDKIREYIESGYYVLQSTIVPDDADAFWTVQETIDAFGCPV